MLSSLLPGWHRVKAYTVAAEFFQWEFVSLGQAIGPAIFTIIAPGFTEEVSNASLLECIAHIPKQSSLGS